MVSFGERTRPLYERLALRYLDREHLAGVRCMDALSPEQMNDAEYLETRLSHEVEKTVEELHCDVVILLATAFAGLSGDASHEIPVIDPVDAMIRELESSVTDKRVVRLLTDNTVPQRKVMTGVSDELASVYLNFPTD